MRETKRQLLVWATLLLVLGLGCTTTVVVRGGKVTVTGIPADVRTITLTLETERSIITVEVDVNGGRAGPVELGPRFLGQTYAPGNIKISTFDGGGNEKRFENDNDVEIRDTDQEQELPLSDFKEVR